MNNTKNKNNADWSESELSAFKKRVMRHVYISWFAKKILLPAFVILPVSALILLRELSSVSLGSILGTAILKLQDFNFIGLWNYFIATIRYTELDSLLVMSSSFLLAVFFGRRIIRDFYAYLIRDSLALPYFQKMRR